MLTLHLHRTQDTEVSEKFQSPVCDKVYQQDTSWGKNKPRWQHVFGVSKLTKCFFIHYLIRFSQLWSRTGPVISILQISQQRHVTGDWVCLKPNSWFVLAGPVIENRPSNTGHRSPIPAQGRKIAGHGAASLACVTDLEKPARPTRSRHTATKTRHGHQGPPCGSAAKSPPAARDSWVWPLGWEEPLEKGKATHSRILARRSPGTV